MAEDALSQAELDTLLSKSAPAPRGTVRATIARVAPPATPSPRRTPANARSAAPAPPVRPHDFKQPRSADDEQLRTLRTLHASFARDLGPALSNMLRSTVDVQLISVDQVSYREFLTSLDKPTCLNVLRAAPLHGPLALDVSPMILFPMIDRLLGGAGKLSSVPRRPLTEIELRLAARITAAVLDVLAKAWRGVAEIGFAVDRVESDPHAAKLLVPHEAVLRVGLELTINAARGPLSLCLPLGALRPIADLLALGPIATGARAVTTSQSDAPSAENLRQSTVELIVQLAETRVSTGDLLNLRVGDVITTHQSVNSPLAVRVGGVTKFRGQPGALQGHKAVRIEEPQ